MPVGDVIPPGIASDSIEMELDLSAEPNPADPPRVLFGVGFEGTYKRHKVVCRVLDPSRKKLWKDQASSPGERDSAKIWNVLFEIAFFPRTNGVHTVEVGLDGKIECRRNIEVTTIGGQIH